MLPKSIFLALGFVLFLGAAPRARAATCDADVLAPEARDLSKQLAPVATGLRRDVLDLAAKAFVTGRCLGQVRREVLTVIDYSLPSDLERMWVFDVRSNKLLFREHVAHGRGSGERWARTFSNRGESHESSLGAFVTGTTYTGKHGLSLHLHGLEPGINGAAEDRSVVIHGATYVTAAFIRRFGRAGRSWGCPAVDPRVAPALIDAVKEGTFLWVYYPDHRWLSQSRYVAAGE